MKKVCILALILTLLVSGALAEGDAPAVYRTADISPAGLMAVYEALGREAAGESVAVKISTGEDGSNYLRPELIGGFVQAVNGTLVECNTAYGGRRASTAVHYQLAEDHGYTAIADVDILDENGSMTLPVEGGAVLTENYVGANLRNYDFLVVLSHFKGHAMGGFGGAIKNLSIGCASSEGKSHIHSGGTGGSMWGGDQDAFLEAMAEAAKSVVDYFGDGERALYINVMNRLSVDCDCDGNPAEPDMHDIGILASLDPVALDQACVDLVYAAPDGASLIRRIESRNGIHTLEHAGEIGFGSRAYTLIDIDAAEAEPKENESMYIYAHVGGQVLPITPEDNSSVDALRALLSQGPLTVEMSDYGNFEKVGPIGTTLPANDRQITTVPGDVILYQGNSITMYYDTNAWNFTKLGHIEGATRDSMLGALGDGNVTVTFSLEP